MVDLAGVELLLNIFWLALTAFAVWLSFRDQIGGKEGERLSYFKILFALTCIAVLLFPVVSASDDLHPTQEIFEDSSKRVQPTVAPVLHGDAASGMAMLLVFLSFPALFRSQKAYLLRATPVVAKGLVGHHQLAAFRAPPSLL